MIRMKNPLIPLQAIRVEDLHLQKMPTRNLGAYSETTEIDAASFFPSKKFRMYFSIFTDFWAGDRERDHFEREAKKNLSCLLYAEILKRLNEVRAAINDDERAEALSIINQLMKDITESIV